MTQDPAGRRADVPVAEATVQAAELCRRLGHHVEEARWPDFGKGFAEAFLTLWATGAAEIVAGLTKAHGKAPDSGLLEPFTLNLAQRVRALSPGAIAAAKEIVGRAARAYLGQFQRYDVLLTPVLASPPVRLGLVRGDVAFPRLVERLTAYVGYTPIVNVAGNTAMSVPLAWTRDGLPLGAQFAAAPGQERTLFELGFELETAQPWAQRRPPVQA
jgi:amidase